MVVEIDWHGSVKDLVEALSSSFLEILSVDVEAEAKRRSPVDRGMMRAGIHYSQISPVTFVISSNVFYDVYWEEGTRYHFLPYFTNGIINDFGKWAMRVRGMAESDLVKQIGCMVHAEARHMYSGGIDYAQRNINIPGYAEDVVQEALRRQK